MSHGSRSKVMLVEVKGPIGQGKPQCHDIGRRAHINITFNGCFVYIFHLGCDLEINVVMTTMSCSHADFVFQYLMLVHNRF